MSSKPSPLPLDAATHLKLVSLKLFSEHGIDGVTVRQIAKAAGQKNHAALTYHFGSKEELVRELIVDGAQKINIRRNHWLDACEASGGPYDLLEVITGILYTSIDPDPPAQGECYNRFVFSLLLSNRTLFNNAMAGRWNSGYQRGLEHIRRLMSPVPRAEINRRLVFMGASLGAILASRETELADRSREHRMWTDPTTLGKAAQSLTAMVECCQWEPQGPID
jgi:AcrR family transcriptional regulator